jgi:hypothetical protein
MSNGPLIRPLHRQRSGRHRTVRVLGQEELAERLNVAPEGVAERLRELGWRFHQDSAGRIWATDQDVSRE